MVLPINRLPKPADKPAQANTTCAWLTNSLRRSGQFWYGPIVIRPMIFIHSFE
jgi:hypothetical protein